MGTVTNLKRANQIAPELPRLVEEYLSDLRAENRSPHTLKNYRADLLAFQRFYQGALEALSATVLRQYFAGMGEASPATQARRRASLKSFLGWCYQHDLTPTNPMEKLGSVKLPETQPRALALAEVDKILSVIKNDRDRVLFTLLSETGLRISEALALKVEDLRFDAQELRVNGKGQKERTAFLTKTESLRLLRRYLRKSGITSGFVFPPDERKQRAGASGKPLTYSVICRAWSRYCAEAGIDCTIHQLRHSYATDLINRGVRVEMVSKLLGHKNLQTTQRYATVSDQALKRTLEELR
ncbi:Tyrosine recombinase XerD [compost metagenome]